MDPTEIIALLIVAVAALLLVRHYRKSKGDCCGTGCFKTKEDEKKK